MFRRHLLFEAIVVVFGFYATLSLLDVTAQNKTTPMSKQDEASMTTRNKATPISKQDETSMTTGATADLPQLAPVTCRKNSTFRIPNIIHHIWFGDRQLMFCHYISMRSAALINQPDEVRLYYDREGPRGPYWDRYRAEVPCLKMIKMKAPDSVFGNKVNNVVHKADVARLQIILETGGIYLDVDTVVTRPFDMLMEYSCVLGKLRGGAYGNAVIIAEPRAPFVDKWLESYITFVDSSWVSHSTQMPPKLHDKHPDLPLHVEDTSFYRPRPTDGMEWFEKKNFDFSSSFCVHLFVREYRKSTLQMTERDVLSFNATYGSLARIGLYGKPDLIS